MRHDASMSRCIHVHTARNHCRISLHVGFWPLNWVVDVDGPWIR